MYIPSQVIVQHYFDRHRALAGGVASAGISFGCLTMSPLMRLSIEHYGMRGGLLIVAAMSLQCLVPAMLFFPHPRTRTRKQKPGKKAKSIGVNKGDLDPCVTFVSDQKNSKGSHGDTDYEKKVQEIPLTETKDEGSHEKINKDTLSKKPISFMKVLQSVCDTLDITLLGHCGFLLLACSALPTHVGIATFNSYTIQRAIILGVDPVIASFIFTALGSGSMVGRFLTGVVGNMSCSNRTVQYGCTAMMVGVGVLVSIIHTDAPAYHIAMGGFIGFFVGKDKTI